MPNFRERFEDWRDQRTLDADDPGAPPGYLLDPDDERRPFGLDEDRGLKARCAELVDPEHWDLPGDPLARGDGEQED